MKKRSFLLIGTLAIILSSCLVKSLHQFYTEDDVIYNESLIGSWLDSDSTKWKISRYSFSKGFMKGDSLDNSYLVEMYEEDSVPTSKFNVHLFQLNEKFYLDFAPIRDDQYENMGDIHLVSTHSIARIKFQQNGKVGISWFNENWLAELFEENRIKISHEVINQDKGEYVLTASTGELQKFLLKYDEVTDANRFLDDDNYLNITLAKIK